MSVQHATQAVSDHFWLVSFFPTDNDAGEKTNIARFENEKELAHGHPTL